MKLWSLLLAVAWLLAPAATPSHAEPNPAKDAQHDPSAAPETRAVLIGRFRIRDRRPAEGVKLRLNFTLYAEFDDEVADPMTRFVEAHRHRLRNEVLIAIRTADLSDFLEPDLDRLRTRIQARLHRAEPRVRLRELLIGEFEYFID